MNVTNLTYSKTIQSAQYEPETLEMVAVLEENDDPKKCAQELRATVTEALGRRAAAGASSAGSKSTATSTKSSEGKSSGREAAEEASKGKSSKDAKAGSGKGKTKKKPVAYDRSVKAHKTEFGKILGEHFPDWKKGDDSKERAKTLSEELTGTDMFSGEGELLDSFVDAVKAGMGGEEDDL